MERRQLGSGGAGRQDLGTIALAPSQPRLCEMLAGVLERGGLLEARLSRLPLTLHPNFGEVPEMTGGQICDFLQPSGLGSPPTPGFKGLWDGKEEGSEMRRPSPLPAPLPKSVRKARPNPKPKPPLSCAKVHAHPGQLAWGLAGTLEGNGGEGRKDWPSSLPPQSQSPLCSRREKASGHRQGRCS